MVEPSSFIISYCSVLSLISEDAYRNVSNQAFHEPTAMNKAMVASTGVHSGKMIFQKILKSPAPSIFADSVRLPGRPRIYVRMIIRLNALTKLGRI
ncbi:hypothetical protein D3C75_1022930 [compost metagenome]